MSTEKKVTFDAEGQPIVTVTIAGWHDAFRFAWAMSHLQCDFSDVARRIGGSLKRKVGAQAFADMSAHFTSNETYRWIRDDDELVAAGD